jgi:hypothetical protein
MTPSWNGFPFLGYLFDPGSSALMPSKAFFSPSLTSPFSGTSSLPFHHSVHISQQSQSSRHHLACSYPGLGKLRPWQLYGAKVRDFPNGLLLFLIPQLSYYAWQWVEILCQVHVALGFGS